MQTLCSVPCWTRSTLTVLCSGGRQEAHVKFRTPQQEHDFGHPYQLGHLEAADKPDESMLMTLPVSAPLAWPGNDSVQWWGCQRDCGSWICIPDSSSCHVWVTSCALISTRQAAGCQTSVSCLVEFCSGRMCKCWDSSSAPKLLSRAGETCCAVMTTHCSPHSGDGCCAGAAWRRCSHGI